MASSDISHTPVALVYQSATLHAHLRQALGDAGASVVYESATASFDRQDLDRSGATVVVVNLDPDSDEDLEAIDELLVDDARKIIVNDGELTSKLSGWDQARWARHLVAKIFGGHDLLPQRPPGAEEVPVRGMPQHGLDSAQKPSSMSSPVVSNAAEETASREITEAFSSFSVDSSLAGAAASARDELEAALRDFGFVSDAGAAAPAAGLDADVPAGAAATPASEPVENPFGALDFELAEGLDSADPASSVAVNTDDQDSQPAAHAKVVDEFDALFSFDPEPAAARPLAESEPAADQAAAPDFDLDFASSLAEIAEDDDQPPVAAEAAETLNESTFDFDFEFDSATDADATDSKPGMAPDAEALIDFDQAFARSEPTGHGDDVDDPAAAALPAVGQSGPERFAAGRSAAVTGERSIEQLLAGLDMQLTDFEPEPSAQVADPASRPAGADALTSAASEPPAPDRFASFSFELEAIDEAPADAPERAVVEQILTVPSSKGRVAAAVAAAAAVTAAKAAETSTAAPVLAPFDHLFDEPEVAAGVPEMAATGLQRVWVLGASIGGPDAVREFLSGIPASTSNLFLLAQHMGADFVDLMIGQLARASALPVRMAVSGEITTHGQVLVVPLAERLLLDRDGQVSIEALPAPSAYSPSIDQVLKDVADQFGAAAGAIIFSGMAHDAIEGAKYLAGKGGVVWAQDPATCVVSSMIDGAMEAGVVKLVASPAELAARFVAEFP